MAPPPRLLVVVHSRQGSTRLLCDLAVGAARRDVPGVEVQVLDAHQAGPDAVLAAGALLLATPARFGSMAGMTQDFLERIYHPCLDRTVGLPWALLVKGDTDVDGAVTRVERIATGLRWRRALPPVTVVGSIAPEDGERAADLGATLAAGLEAGIF